MDLRCSIDLPQISVCVTGRARILPLMGWMRTVCLLIDKMLLVGTVTQSPMMVSVDCEVGIQKPHTSLERQGLARNHDQVLPSIPSLHTIESSGFVFVKLGS